MKPWRTRIERIEQLYGSIVAAASRLLAVAAAAVCIAVAPQFARLGTPAWRLVAAALLAASLAPLAYHARRRWRRRCDPKLVITTTILTCEPRRGRAALRALQLHSQTTKRSDRGSPQLAQLHLEQTLAAASTFKIRDQAHRQAWVRTAAATFCAMLVLAAVAPDPLRIVEGYDILFARQNVAPLPMKWLHDVHISAQPPAYLGKKEHPLPSFSGVSLPRGTRITVRAHATHRRRRLALTDGVRFADFHDEGDNALVSRWTVENDARIRVVARFGEVVIEEPRALDLHMIADLAPQVDLDDAPRTIKLIEHERIAVHYKARDDHALYEVDLVIASGDRVERRELARPQGSRKHDRGGTDLLASDPFLERSHLPVVITVEARDGDPVTGPKWGISEAVTIIPPIIAEREAQRYQALHTTLRRFVDVLGAELDEAPRPARMALRRREAMQLLERTLDTPIAGLYLPARFETLLRGQLRRLKKAYKRPRRALSTPLGSRIGATETAVLTIDAALDVLGERDSRATAGRLADVTEQLAQRLGEEQHAAHPATKVPLLALLSVLHDGGQQLSVLGRLGRDLGGIVAGDLRRIRRALADEDLHHAELAAHDLAARLRMPDPSFRSSGGGGGGVEAGAQSSEADVPGAAEEISALDEALRQLRRDHAREIDRVERAMREARSEEQMRAQADELRRRAGEVREAVRPLPRHAAAPQSAAATAAQGRSEAEAAARSMEQNDVESAVENLERAVKALKRAENAGRHAAAGSADRRVAKRASEARAKLEAQLKRSAELLDKGQKYASKGAEKLLREAAKSESELANRARSLRQLSDESGIPLPGEQLQKLGEAASKMRAAGKHFRQGDGAAGLKAQRQAQRMLEMTGDRGEQRGRRSGTEGDAKSMARDANVPDKSAKDPAREFRQRVGLGLKQHVPAHLRKAVRRYAEALLK